MLGSTRRRPPDVLALGWIQATTTWQWLATERWIALLGGAPPTHWLPPSQWHLSWLLYDPDDTGHHQALDDTLREGLTDDEHPQIADHLRSLFPRARSRAGVRGSAESQVASAMHSCNGAP